MAKPESERPRSKYFTKHYVVEEADLTEIGCMRCKCIFAVDYKWLKYEGDYAIIPCPYCGAVNRRWV